MIIPIVSVPNVINKTVIYSDTVLNLKEKGKNMKVTSISNVSENALEDCLKCIFEANKEVIFNTIQYSKNNEIVYFYTDKEISVSKWKDSQAIKYSPLSKTVSILEEIKRILQSDKCQDEDSISIYNISRVINRKEKSMQQLKKNFEYQLNSAIATRFSRFSTIVVHDFDYKKNEISISFTTDASNVKSYKEIRFAKKNEEIYISRSEELLYIDDLFLITADIINAFYDKFTTFSSFEACYCGNINPINSKFMIEIDRYGIGIHLQNESFFTRSFCLKKVTYDDDYMYKGNSSKVASIVKESSDAIFNKIYVKIDECPEWMRDDLREIRQNEIEKERKYQKKLDLKRKIFPFLKIK